MLSRFRGWWTVFWVASVSALGLVPLVVDARIGRIEDLLHGRADPAMDLLTDLASVHVRQRSLQRHVDAVPDPTLVQNLDVLVELERTLLARLDVLLAGWEPELQEDLALLRRASDAWHRQGGVGGVGRVAADEEALHYALLDAIEHVQVRLDSLVNEGHDQLTGNRRLQSRGASAMLILALFALSMSALVGRRLQGLVRTAQDRQVEAVQARAEVSAVLDATGDAVLVVDPRGIVQRANAATTRLTGLDNDAIVGQSVHDLMHGRAPTWLAHAARTCPVLRLVAQSEAGELDDGVMWRNDGARRSVRITVRPLGDGRSDAVLTLSDVTGLRQTEAALRRAVDARDEAMAIVGHDLRNPLSSILAGSELLVDVPLSEERRRQELESIRTAASRMNRMIRDLLDIATIDAGALAVRRAPIEVSGMLAEAAAMVQHPLREREVELAVDASSALPAIEGDLDRLLQAIENLLLNAIRHSPEGGCVLLAARGLAAGKADEAGKANGAGAGPMIEISVEDSGPGIPEDELPHLFERFWTRERTGRGARRRRQGGRGVGTGLGLAIVRGIVAAHGGSVGVESEPGRGARFWIRLPVVWRGPTREEASPGSS